MDFNKWYSNEPMPESRRSAADALYKLNKDMAKTAWDYQQKQIDEARRIFEKVKEMDSEGRSDPGDDYYDYHFHRDADEWLRRNQGEK